MLGCVVLTTAALGAYSAEGAPQGATVVNEWRFDRAGDTEGWLAAHHLQDFIAADGALRMTITGGDPYFHAPPYEFDGLRSHLLEVRALLPEAARWQRMQLFFGTPEAPHHSPERQLWSTKTTGDGGVIFLFDLHRHEQAMGRVMNLRLDIDGAPEGSVARIDSIRILQPPARVRTSLSVGAELVQSGSAVEVKLQVENAGGEDAPAVECSLDTDGTMQRTDAPEAPLMIPALAPRETHEATMSYRVVARDAPASVRLVPPLGSLVPPADVTVMAVGSLRPPDAPPRRRGSVFRADDGSICVDGVVRLAIERLPDGRYGPVRLFADDGTMLGASACLVRHPSLSPARTTAPLFPTEGLIARDGRAVTFSGPTAAPGLSAEIACALTGDGTIRLTHRLRAKQDVAVYRFDGPMLHLGEACFGTETKRAIFPGLEYLGPGESSSNTEDINPPGNTRFSPEPTDVTVPIMIHQGPGPAIGLSWDNRADWAAGEAFPTPVFSSPNAVEGQQNHLLGIFAPSAPAYVPPNATIALRPFELQAGMTIELSAEIWTGESPEDVLAQYLAKRWDGTIPGLVRSRRQELELCRFAYTDSCYSPEEKGWMHAHWQGKWGYAPHAFNVLALLMDAERERDRQEAQRLRTLATEVWDAARAKGQLHPPPLLLALLVGDVEQAVRACRGAGQGAARSQLPNGGWRFVPREEHRDLARWGNESLGVTGSRVPNLQRAALVTADPELVSAFMRTVEYCDRFTVPRGGQTWELAVHTPDIMASADGVEIYLAAYQLTGERKYLKRARHWAVSGLPFVFFWDDPNVAALHFSTIPVFGATHYRGSWFGRPVQWCGLDYAKSLIRLSRFQDELPGETIPWQRIAEGILRSAMIQQYADGPLRGSYPDFWLFHDDRGDGPAINPQLILANLWMQDDYDPDVRTVVAPVGGTRAHVSALAHVSAEARANTLQIRSKRSSGVTVAFIVANIGAPKGVRSGVQLSAVSDPGQERGYRYDADARLLTATVAAGADGVARLTVDLQ
ncbi:MAG: hypothetical protein PVH68_07470 [Armatimonadota bacterium]|jgi:hypothetical protein